MRTYLSSTVSCRADIERDVLLLAMIDRFGKGTGIGLGFVQGFRLTRWRNRFDR